MLRYTSKENYVHKEWTTGRRRGHLYSVLLQESRAWIVGQVLMVGCNAGSTLPLIEELPSVSHVVGLDINSEAIAIAGDWMRPYPCIDTICRNYLDPDPVWAEKFNTIIMFDVIEHFYPGDMPAVIKRTFDILAPRGCVLAFSPKSCYEKPNEMAFDPAHRQWFTTLEEFWTPWCPPFALQSAWREQRPNPRDKKHHDGFFAQLTKHDPRGED